MLTSQSSFESSGVTTFFVIYTLEGMDAEALIEFYKDALAHADWVTTFSGTTNDTDGTLIGAKEATDTSNALVVSTTAGDGEGVLEVSVSISVQE